MKINAFFSSGLLAAALLLAGCNRSTPESTPATATPPAQAKARYVCPMGCQGSESTKPGKCPVCEMTLEKKS